MQKQHKLRRTRVSADQDISMQDTSKPVNQILNLMLWYPDVLPTDILVS
jgi:hypothetical protein